MNIPELKEWLEEQITGYEREIEIVKQSNRKSPIPDLISRRVIETHIMDYRNILRKLSS